MSVIELHLFVIVVLILCWLTINGRIAEWNHRDWGDSRFGWLFGVYGDLNTMKIIHRCIGWLGVVAILVAYCGYMYHYVSGR
jgi:hypothetical protein